MSKIYDLEFVKIPTEFRRDKRLFLFNLLEKREEYLSQLFNRYCDYPKERFKKQEFEFLDRQYDDGFHVIYICVPIPRKFDKPKNYCAAYCVVYRLKDYNAEPIKLFNIVLSPGGKSYICRFDGYGHRFFGGAGDNVEQVIENVRNIALGEISLKNNGTV
ncbi:MAG: hypothetical protein IKD04_02530 [Clostridia bacterium]|nr:hypothetical protein [Clostridia bacterium]